jgi:hypothetical protein
VKAMGGEKYATWPTKMLVDVHMDFVIVRRRTNLQSEEGAYDSHMNIEDSHHLLECLGVKPSHERDERRQQGLEVRGG